MPQALIPSPHLRLAALALGAVLGAGQVSTQAPAQVPGPDRAPRVVDGDGLRAPAILADPSTSAVPGMVDESALRYYAAQKQRARMKAEAARLKRLYPGWVEPSDLDNLKPSPPEEAPLWDLFTAGRMAELRAVINARRAADPSWQPSEELADKLMRAEFRGRLMALGAKRPEEVVGLYRADRPALDTGDVESTWIVADALAETDNGEDAFALYRTILETSVDAGARRATILKAMAHLSMARAEQLIAMGRGEAQRQETGKADLPAEFDPIRIDITRMQIAAFLHDDPSREPLPADLVALQTFARKSNDPTQTGLLGWYAYKRRAFHDALDWLKTAIASGGDAMVAHGLAHTLRALNRLREAEEVAYAWRDRFIGNEILFIDLLERTLTQQSPPFVEPARIDRYAKVTAASGSGEGAQALAWYAYNSCQFESALEWFQRASAWLPKESTVFGYALTLQRLKRQREYLEVINRYDGLFPKVVDLLFKENPEGPQQPCLQAGGQQAAARLPSPLAAAFDPRATYGRVPKPGAPAGGPDARPAAVARKEFPLPVALDNPLRFPPASVSRALGEVRPDAYAREPVATPAPLVARRVPGAGPMPYERYGYVLLPGYDGIDKAVALGLPAEGTLWRQQQADQRSDAARGASEDDRFSGPGRSSSLSTDRQQGLP